MLEGGLELRGFGVAFGDQVVLAPLDLVLPARGCVVLLGPAGAGKSTLLRTLAGANHAQPSLRTVGSVLFDGKPLHPTALPSLVSQHARLMVSSVLENLLSGGVDRLAIPPGGQLAWAEAFLARLGLQDLIPLLRAPVVSLSVGAQRLVSIARPLGRGPCALLVDEPTAGLDEGAAAAVIRLLRQAAVDRLVLTITHHQGHAALLGGDAILLAGGRVIEHRPVAELLAAPISRAAQDFVKTGSCAVSSLHTTAEDLDESAEPPPPLPRELVRGPSRVGPRNFHWVIRGSLAGLPRPGLLEDLDDDLDMLGDLGVNVLVTLEETRTIPPASLSRRDIENLHFPIPDMGAPDIDAAIRHCQEIKHRQAAGDVVAYHCRAGLGRTGTMLAAFLIIDEHDAVSAIDRVRRVQPRFIQSDVQIEFLEQLHCRMRADGAQAATPSTRGNQGETNVIG